MGIDEVVGDKRRTVMDLARQYGVSNVRVFGSVARGEARSDSDVDLLVDVRAEVGIGFFSLWGALEDLLGNGAEISIPFLGLLVLGERALSREGSR